MLVGLVFYSEYGAVWETFLYVWFREMTMQLSLPVLQAGEIGQFLF